MKTGLAALLLAAASLAGCLELAAEFTCQSSEACVGAGGQGVCETGGSCSFADPGCPSRRRYGARSAPELEGTCVAPDAALRLIVPAADTFLDAAPRPHAAEPFLGVYTSPARTAANVILIKLDLSVVPPVAAVQQATLSLYLLDAGGIPGYTVTAHRIINKNADPAAATGASFDGKGSWSTALAQGDISAAYDQLPVDSKSEYKTWDLTKLVQEWLQDPKTNLGLLLNADLSASADSWRIFASREHPRPELRPYLRLKY
jgi:hypothetical protein